MKQVILHLPEHAPPLRYEIDWLQMQFHCIDEPHLITMITIGLRQMHINAPLNSKQEEDLAVLLSEWDEVRTRILPCGP